MRYGKAPLYLCLLLLLHTASLSASRELADAKLLEQCMNELRARADWYRRHIPAEIYVLDRKLTAMTEGIRFISENYSKLLSTRASHTPLSPHILANALESCHEYKRRYLSHASRFLLFLISGGCLAVLLILKLLIGARVPKEAAKVAGESGAEYPHLR